MSAGDWQFILVLSGTLVGAVTVLVLWGRRKRRERERRDERIQQALYGTAGGDWVNRERQRVDWIEHERLIAEARKQQTPPRRNPTPPPYWNRRSAHHAYGWAPPAARDVGESVVPRSVYEQHFAGGAQPVYGDPDFSGAGGSSGGGGASASWGDSAPSSDSSSGSSGGTD